MCYRGEANSIRLYDECSANRRMLSFDCGYFKGKSHSICWCRVYPLPWWMPNSVQRYHTFCLTLLPHALFAFTFGCKPSFTVKWDIGRGIVVHWQMGGVQGQCVQAANLLRILGWPACKHVNVRLWHIQTVLYKEIIIFKGGRGRNRCQQLIVDRPHDSCLSENVLLDATVAKRSECQPSLPFKSDD